MAMQVARACMVCRPYPKSKNLWVSEGFRYTKNILGLYWDNGKESGKYYTGGLFLLSSGNLRKYHSSSQPVSYLQPLSLDAGMSR